MTTVAVSIGAGVVVFVAVWIVGQAWIRRRHTQPVTPEFLAEMRAVNDEMSRRFPCLPSWRR